MEMALKAWGHMAEMAVVVLRLATVYGPRQRRENGLVNQMLFEAVEGKPISLPMHGLFTRDVIYAADVAKVVIESFRFPKGGLQFVDVGVCHMVSLNDLSAEVIAATYSSRGTRNLPVDPDITYQEVAENDLVPFGGMETLKSGLGKTFEDVKERVSKSGVSKSA